MDVTFQGCDMFKQQGVINISRKGYRLRLTANATQ